MIELKNICKSYNSSGLYQSALKNINIKLSSKGLVSIVGKSGSGKTTLLNIIGSLDKCDFGEVIIDNKNIRDFTDSELDSYRNNYVGFIFQNYNLLDHMSVLDNIRLKLVISGKDVYEANSISEDALKKVGLYKYKDKLPSNLSGGERQRVAIARAIVNDSKIILCDEPTGALDQKTGTEILNLLKELSKDRLVIMVSHNEELAKKYSNRIITMRDGEIVSDTNNKVDEEDESFNSFKTKLDVKTIFKLALENLKLKRKRNILLSLTASIGIIGISIILSISNGFNDSLDEYEQYISNKIPIVISPYKKERYSSKYNNSNIININKNINNNYLNNSFVSYLNNIKEYTYSTKYNYLIDLNIIGHSDNYFEVSNDIFKSMPSNNNIINENYDLLEGRIPSKYNELLLEVTSDNTFSHDISKTLNIKENDTLESIIGKELKIVFNNELYSKNDEEYYINSINKDLYENNNNLTLKVVGIIKVKKSKMEEITSSNNIYYMSSLIDYIVSKNKNSEIVKYQKSKDYNLITKENLNDKTKNELLCYLGNNKCTSSVMIYPKSSKSKDKVIKLLNKYNSNYETNKVSIIDESKSLYDMSLKIINTITIILVFFSSISLFVSSIMIGIITYISVLERKKEIGILRSMGVSKKNLSYIFLMENIILGFVSGIIGIFISIMFSGPINIIFNNLIEADNIFTMRLSDNLLLILLSMFLSMLGAYIPSKKASNESIINALETN